MARLCPNIVLDATSCIINYGVLEYAVQYAGSERVIWGSDFPFYPFQLGLAKVRGAEIDDNAKKAVLGANILRIMANANS
jgi:predicted TIM-barrel fold metal-dependent hydrolase